jgi:hypothetical protein
LKKALAGDVQYINAVGKLIERRCLLLGLNQPAPVRAAELLPDSALPAQTSTDRIRTAIDRIRAKALPQPN